MHGDHWGRVSQRRLDQRFTGPDDAARGFGRALGLAGWQSHQIVKENITTTVTALPGRHAPTPVDRLLPPVMGSMLEFSDRSARRQIYVSDDTLFVDELQEIPIRFESPWMGARARMRSSCSTCRG